jgi:hypothetical protein
LNPAVLDATEAADVAALTAEALIDVRGRTWAEPEVLARTWTGAEVVATTSAR